VFADPAISAVHRPGDVPTMNVKDTLAAIRALGLVAGRVGGEWRINHRNSHKGCVGFCTAYCTSDKDDALAAARAMSQWTDEHPTKRAKLLEEWKHACAEVQSDQWLQPAPTYLGPERRANPRDRITTPAVVRVDGPIPSSYAKCETRRRRALVSRYPTTLALSRQNSI
jgi:hypothetical protein